MGFNTKRNQHSLGVAKQMKLIAKELYPEDTIFENDMFILGLLHDTGYEFTNSQPEHAEIGGETLQLNGYKYWREVYYHGKSNVNYESEALRILNIADFLTDSEGNKTTVEERLNDVKLRYGKDSFAYQDFKKLANELNLL